MPSTALWAVEPWKCEVRTEEDEKPKENEVKVRTLWSGLSRGTERLVVSGGVPTSEYDRMRGPNMAGAFPYPVKYGYCSVGNVIEGDLEGKTVVCLYPHQDMYVVPKDAVYVIPDEVPAARAVLGPNMETAVNILWDAQVSLGDRVLVVGAGVVGFLVAYLAKRVPGTTVLVKDPVSKPDIYKAFDLTELSEEKDFDVVIHCSGNPAGLQDCVDLAGDEATIIEASWYGTSNVNISLGGAFHSRRLNLRASQVGRVPPDRRIRWDFRRRMTLALALLRDPKLDLLLEAIPLRFHAPDFPTAYIAALQRSSGLCVRIQYDD